MDRERKAVNIRLVSNRGNAKGISHSNNYFFNESDFKEMLNLERKRSQRSRKPLILMCLDFSGLVKPKFAHDRRILLKALDTGIRETDIRGWYKKGTIVGILFTEIESASPSVREKLFRRIMTHLISKAGPEVLFNSKVTFHTYPEGKVHDEPVDCFDMRYHKHLDKELVKGSLSEKIKGLVDEASHFLMY